MQKHIVVNYLSFFFFFFAKFQLILKMSIRS